MFAIMEAARLEALHVAQDPATGLRAIIANPPMPDVFRSVLAQQKGHNRHDPISRTAFDQIVWRFGLKISFNPRDIAARFGKAWDYLTNGRVDVSRIACPALQFWKTRDCTAAGFTLSVTEPLVPPPERPAPGWTAVMSPAGMSSHCTPPSWSTMRIACPAEHAPSTRRCTDAESMWVAATLPGATSAANPASVAYCA